MTNLFSFMTVQNTSFRNIFFLHTYMETSERSLISDCLQQSDDIQDEDSSIRSGFCQERGLHVFYRHERCLLSDSNTPGIQGLPVFVSQGMVWQLKDLYSGLLMAPQVFTRVFTLVLAWAHKRGIRFLHDLVDWLVIAHSVSLLLQQQELLLQFCK